MKYQLSFDAEFSQVKRDLKNLGADVQRAAEQQLLQQFGVNSENPSAEEEGGQPFAGEQSQRGEQSEKSDRERTERKRIGGQRPVPIRIARKSRRIQSKRQRKRRRQALTWSSRHEDSLMHQADLYVSKFGEKLKQQYGFLAEPDQPLWHNLERILGDGSASTYFARPTNMACHSFLQHLPMLPGTENLLDLGHNYCIKTNATTSFRSSNPQQLPTHEIDE